MAETKGIKIEGMEIHDCEEFKGWMPADNAEISDEAMAAVSGGKANPDWWKKYSNKPPKYAYNAAVFWKGNESDGLFLIKEAKYIGAPKLGMWGYKIKCASDSEIYNNVPEAMLYK
ncbi:MAG: hypothetical protein K6G19_09225 [Lachnospiraceae bacterium]|nr:hypothetical protein [Lachnospiraceae bacterium]